MPATITSLSAGVGKAADTVTITGTGFIDTPTMSKVWVRKHNSGDPWVAADGARVAFTSATALVLTLNSAEFTEGGLWDIGVSDNADVTPDAFMASALYYFIAGADDGNAVVVGPPDAVYIGGRYVGDFADAFTFNWEEELKRIYTQHSRVPVQTYQGEASYNLEIPLAEIDLENLRDALGTGTQIQDLGGGRRRLTFGGGTGIVYADVMVVLPGPTGLKYALVLYKCCLSASGSMTFGKDEAARIPLKMEVLADTSRPAGDQVGYFEEYAVA